MLVYSIISLIMSNAVNNRRDSSIAYARISILILVNSLIIIYNSSYYNFITDGIILYNGLLCIENYIVTFTIFIYILSILILFLNSVYFFKIINNNTLFNNNKNPLDFYHLIYKNNYMSEQYRIIEYPLIILFCIVGAILLISSFDIISIFLSIELQSYSLYLICSIYRNSESSVNAGLTYFLLGSLSSCIILLGISLLYMNSGTTSLENIYMINNISDIFTFSILYNPSTSPLLESIIGDNFYITELFSSTLSQYLYLQVALVIMSVGFLFKISSAPFHFWSPDVYDAVPTIVTTFIAIIPKISIIIFLYKLIYYTSSDIMTLSWTNNIVISSILSLIIGSVLGLTQYRIKRLYAYSTISHLGFLLLGLSINNIESSKATFFYIIQYSFSNLNAFLILIIIGFTLRKLVTYNINIKDINYSPIQLISQLKGYCNINMFVAISLCITLFSFAGVPPLIGFFAKQMILTSAINSGFIFTTFIAILTSVISAVYYLYLIKVIFFDKSSYILNSKLSNVNYVISSYYSLTVSILTLLISLFLFFDQEVIRLVNII
jgi:NADH-ubiquinone oxidoreductase chain 2